MAAYTLEDIVHHTGIPKNKATEICNMMAMEGYLVPDKGTGKYRLTKDQELLKKIRKLWDQCKNDHTFEQMSGKIEDIIDFGSPLALSEQGPGSTVSDIGIPGLNIILGNPENKQDEEGGTTDEPKGPGLPRGHCILIKGAPGTGKTTLGLQIALHLKKYRARFLTFEEDINQLVNDFQSYIHPDDRIDAESKKETNAYGKGWRIDDIKNVSRSLLKIRTPQAWENPDMVMEELVTMFDRELPHLIVIDSISRFRDLGGDDNARLILRRLIRTLKCRRITAIFTAEDREEENSFEEYEVDGVINLSWAGEMLTLTVKKLRGMKAFKGPHSAAMLAVEDLDRKNHPQHYFISEQQVKEYKSKEDKENLGPFLTAGFNVFPDISVFKSEKEDEQKPKPGENSGTTPHDGHIETKTTGDKGKDKNGKNTINPLGTGTPGLDDLLVIDDENKGFKETETILLVGSAGAGKTLLSLNFIHAGFNPEGGKKSENTLWLNFEGNIGTLRYAIDGFDENFKKPRREMLDASKKMTESQGESDGMFNFIDFPPINLDLNKIVFTLEAIYRTYGINRLVIDSITELERAKGSGQPEVKVFLAGLIQFLRDRKITTMFVCRSDAFFRSIDKIEEQVSSLVDLIICIRNFDVHNQIRKGIYIQKARGRSHNSKIMRLVIESQRGIAVEDSGWDLENLLAGDTSSISNPRVFFKLFYENPAEEIINKKIINDFGIQRYPGDDPKFTLVKKPSIYTEFWSFKGQYSAGHANTRVLSIPDYVVTAFRDNKRLAEVNKYVKSELLRNIEGEHYHIQRYEEKDEHRKSFLFSKKLGLSNRKIDAIPTYTDYGVMVVRIPKLKNSSGLDDKMKKFVKFLDGKAKLVEKTSSQKDLTDLEWVKGNKGNIYSWDVLLKKIKKLNSLKQKDKDVPLPFAFPPMDKKSDFVSFFMEILWSYGGDIFETDIVSKYERYINHTRGGQEDKGNKNRFKDEIEISVFSELFKHFDSITGSITSESFIGGMLPQFIAKIEKDCPEGDVKKVLEDFEERFGIYGFRLKEIQCDEFREWIAKRANEIKSKIVKNKSSVLKLNDEPFKKAIKLILRLVYWAKVVNPVEGDFRHRAILSRNWYSRIFQLKLWKCYECNNPVSTGCSNKSDDNKDKCYENRLTKISRDDSHRLLPLPLADVQLTEKVEKDGNNGEKEKESEIKTYNFFRSVTCINYWSLVMLGNALSPEIGGNFIESLNAPEYYEERLRNRFGMPVTFRELSKKKFREYDPPSYTMMKRNFNNVNKFEWFLDSLFEKIGKTKGKSETKTLTDDDYNRMAFVGGEIKKLSDQLEIPLEVFFQKCENPQKPENTCYANKNIFFHKARQSRTGFYQLEEVFHFQLKQLLTEDDDATRDQYLYKAEEAENQENIVKRIIRLCDEHKNGQNWDEVKWDKILKEISREFRIHVVFELLTYFFHEDRVKAGIGKI